jgi:urease accessory protein
VTGGRPSPRDDRAWCTPGDLPEELLAFNSAVQGGLGVGSVGKVGVLDLALAPSAGMTRIVRQYQRAPLHVFRPIHLDAGRPDMAFVYLQQQGDGIVQGDRYRMDFDCAPGSATHITTQASTKIFGARQNFATQLVNLHVGPGAVLEYLPDPVVPFRGSRMFQRTCLTVDPDSTVILGETLLPGRVARDEAHAYDLYWAETEVRDPGGSLLFADVLRMRANGAEHPKSPGLLGPYDVVASLYVVTTSVDSSVMVTRLRAALADDPDVLVGVSELPNGCGTAVRLLGYTSKTLQAGVRTVWNAARMALLGTPAPDLRKG